MEKENQINELMSSAIDKIKSLVDTNTVVGVPFETKEGTLIIPLTKVSVGFAVGGGEYGSDSKDFKKADKFPFAGGSGAGLSMNPVGLLMVKGEEIKLIHVDEKSPFGKVLDTIPAVISKLTPLFKKEEEK